MTGRDDGPARLFLVDDHPTLREGLRLFLEHSGFEVCGEAGDASSALAAIPRADPRLVMVDLSLDGENGLVLLRSLAERHPGIPLLVYSMHEDPFRIRQALSSGASGYVAKREASTHLTRALEELLAGRTYLGPAANAALAADSGEAREPDPLSPRELAIYSLLAQGYGTPAIADRLGVSRRTVESYYSRILAKLGLSGMEALRRHVATERPDL